MTYKGRLPEKPIRPNIAGLLAKKNSKVKKQTNIYIYVHVHSAGIQID